MNRPRRRTAWLTLVAVAAIVMTIVVGGKLRHRLWDATQDLRFQNDISNAFSWGMHANRVGFFSLYDSQWQGDDLRSKYQLDYAPLRLLAATLWTRWLESEYPGIQSWENRYSYVRPLLYANRLAELTSAAAIFVLVFIMGSRGTGRSCDQSGHEKGAIHSLATGRTTWLAATAAGLFWFNPALMFNAHAWPQWDVWLLPFFLWAAILAHYRKWDGAGFLLATGAMLKGQLLIVMPVFLLWAIFSKNLSHVLRLMIGLILATALIASPWLIGGMDGCIFVVLFCAAGLILCAALVAAKRLRLQTTFLIVECMIPFAIFVSLVVFDGSLTWFRISFMQSTQQFSGHWIVGMAANLPAILEDLFHWEYDKSVALLFFPSIRITTLLVLSYIAGMAFCAAMIVRHEKKADPRFLIALVMPWLLMYTLLPQMHDRYLVYAASLSAMWVCLGVGAFLCHAFLTLLSILAMLHTMLLANRTYRELGNVVRETHPDVAWALCIIVIVLFFMMWKPEAATGGGQEEEAL